MILAGIDEAGYGPLLGPLVVGCCAFAVRPQDPEGGDSDPAQSSAVPSADPISTPELPCLWKRLAKLVSRSRSRSGRKIHVNDSKDVYSPSIGLKELERALLVMLLARGDRLSCFDDVLTLAASDALPHLARHSWYGVSAQERFPFEQELMPLKLFANGLAVEMQRCGVRLASLRATVIPEYQLNDLVARTRNKASTLFSIAAGHIDHLLTAYGHQHLTIHCDRQGGREHYAQLLRLMFEAWPLELIHERDGHSEYLLHHPHGTTIADTATPPPPVRIIFREKAESQSMAVAMASMVAKYLREGLMRRFNAFWHGHCPGVEPTAGYYSDGMRFLQDIDAKRKELGIGDEMLIRSR